jgi:predicted AAA+ superfamily ATPase
VLERVLAGRVRTALADTPVVFLQGPRQAGKSTLARSLVGPRGLSRYVTLDDATHRGAAQADPEGFLEGLGGSAVLDEVQLAPGLFRAIKATVDRDRRPGRFLLTGSADALLVPGVAESLAGRMEVLTLWPLHQAEIAGRLPRFIARAFGKGPPEPAGGGRGPRLLDRMQRGGFPEVRSREAIDRRAAWFGSYLSLVLQRDVRELSDVAGLAEMPRLLALLAARSPGLLNFAEVSRSLSMPQTTLKRYVALFEAAMLVRFLPAWPGEPGRRLAKAPRILVADTGLACHLLGADAARIEADPVLLGNLLQSFATLEILREAAAVPDPPRLLHYRGFTGREVDVVLEDRAGRVVGVEVKAAASVGPADFAGLRALAADAGERFHRGIVLHRGREVVPFGPGLFALPVEALWR